MSETPKRRRYQFSIRTLLWITGAVAVALGILVNFPEVVILTVIVAVAVAGLLLIPLVPFFIVRAFLLWATGLLFRNKDSTVSDSSAPAPIPPKD